MIGPDYFFEIGIYRCPAKQHYEELANGKRKYVEQLEYEPQNYENVSTWYDQNRWPSWDYNEAVGWLRLYRFGSQIRGELWFIRAKRITRGAKKQFSNLGKVFELSFDPSHSEQDIREEIFRALKDAANNRPIKGRYLDLKCFQSTSSALRWRKILRFEDNDV